MTAPLRRVGSFNELPHGDPEGPSLREAISEVPHPDEDQIAAYLEGGSCLAATGMAVGDVLSGDDRPVAVLATLTDGTWMWSSDLAYYVRTYHVRVPEDLVAHAAALSWTPPALSVADLIKITQRLFED